ncbi:MAG: alanine--tRNA ligase [Chitinivibrionia bacterium]|nr:alanine--tRNA ligase [Chitinivibrionia bacterium]
MNTHPAHRAPDEHARAALRRGARGFSAEDIRRSYLDFFVSKNHRVVPSAPLVPQDPTLLFTSAGMVQFKSYYADPEAAPYRTAASLQKCLRAGGKQSDLENVGRTLRHHTFFEMLGNFSFGDYFKKESIEYAWELVVDVWRFDRERLWISIYEEDQEAFDLWARHIGFPERRIVRLGKKDNFWGPVGDTGVCGPSSEIYYDTGSKRGCARAECKPGCDCDRYIEFWNLVFPQFFLTERGVYDALPKPGIDTGMGLERVAFILQEAQDNFHTDLFLPIRAAIESALPAGTDRAKASMAVNVAADHIRALCFAMTEGLIPSNEGRGYILRRLLRRSLTKMHPFGIRAPFLHAGVDSVASVMAVRYPEIGERAAFIKKAIHAEEERFLVTLEQGLERLESVISRCTREKNRVMPGEDAFVLYDTYGFPPELTSELAMDAGLAVDMDAFAAAMRAQKERARSGGFHVGADVPGARPFRELRKSGDTTFLGYETLSCESWCAALRIGEGGGGGRTAEGEGPDRLLELIFEETVFYPESGGQVGDTGAVTCAEARFEVSGVRAQNGKIVHLIPLGAGRADGEDGGEALERLLAGAKCTLSVNPVLRSATARNHTATHLLHAALRSVLGGHVVQAGSFVEPGRLRFDFNHFQALSREELSAVEAFVNQAILKNVELEHRIMKYAEAVRAGVIALFGEKYGEDVRVIEVEGISRELCGGTHVARTGDIGLFLVRQEGSVSSGVRRIEALTGTGAMDYIHHVIGQREALAAVLRTSPEETAGKVRALIAEADELKKRLESRESKIVGDRIGEAVHSARAIGRFSFATLEMESGDIAALRAAGDSLREKLERGVGLLLLAASKKPMALVVVSEDVVREGGLNAQTLTAHLSRALSLRGGGKPHMAQVGLDSRNDFDRVVSETIRFLKEAE